MNRAARATARVDRATARAIAELKRELDQIWADCDQGRLTRREAETAHDRAIAAAGLPLGFAGEPSCDPRAD